jgi:hypothetical protein
MYRRFGGRHRRGCAPACSLSDASESSVSRFHIGEVVWVLGAFWVQGVQWDLSDEEAEDGQPVHAVQVTPATTATTPVLPVAKPSLEEEVGRGAKCIDDLEATAAPASPVVDQTDQPVASLLALSQTHIFFEQKPWDQPDGLTLTQPPPQDKYNQAPPPKKPRLSHSVELPHGSIRLSEPSANIKLLTLLLPHGWAKRCTRRPSSGKWDFVLVPPTGKRLRGRKELLEFQAKNPNVPIDTEVTHHRIPWSSGRDSGSLGHPGRTCYCRDHTQRLTHSRSTSSSPHQYLSHFFLIMYTLSCYV